MEMTDEQLDEMKAKLVETTGILKEAKRAVAAAEAPVRNWITVSKVYELLVRLQAGWRCIRDQEGRLDDGMCKGGHQAYGAGVLILELKYNPVAGITMFVHDSRHIQARRPEPGKDDIRDFHSVRRTETEGRTLDGCPMQTVTLSTCADDNRASIEFAKDRLCAQFKKEALALCEQWVGIVENDIAELSKEVTLPGISLRP